MHSYVNTRDIHNRFVEQKENKSRVKVEEKKVVIDEGPATKVYKDP